MSWYKEFEAEENEFMRDYIENLITDKLETTDYEKLFFQNLPPSDDWQPRGELKKIEINRPTLEGFEKTFKELDEKMKLFKKQEKERFLEVISHLPNSITSYYIEETKKRGIPDYIFFNKNNNKEITYICEKLSSSFRIKLSHTPLLTNNEIIMKWNDLIANYY